MTKYPGATILRIFLFSLSVLSAGVTGFLFWDHRQTLHQELADTLTQLEKGEDGIEAVARMLDEKLRMDLIEPTQQLQEVVQDIDVGDKPSAKQAIREAMDSASSDLFAIGVAFHHFRFFPYKRLFGPYYARTYGGGRDCYTSDHQQYCYFQLEYFYDYTGNGTVKLGQTESNKSEWYGQFLRPQEPIVETFTRPHFNPHDSTLLVDYARAVYRHDARGNPRFMGLVYAQYSYDFLKQLVNRIDLGRKGYGMLITERGSYLVHPQDEFVLHRERTVGTSYCSDPAKTGGLDSPLCQNPDLPDRHYCSASMEHGPFDLHDPLTDSPAKAFIYPIPSIKGCLLAILNVDELERKPLVRHRLMDLAIAMVITGLLFGLFFAYQHLAGSIREWTIITLVSLLFSGSIGFIWYVDYSYPRGPTADKATDRLPQVLKMAKLFATRSELPVIDSGTRDAFLVAYREMSNELGYRPPVEIPTGVFIQSIEFVSSTNVHVTGYIWQRYTRGRHKGVSRGVILPEANEPDIHLVYHEPEPSGISECQAPVKDFTTLEGQETRDCTELIGWHFAATLRQTFTYDLYPFDRQEVWLRLWHQDFDRNVILVPDLESYDLMLPQSTPGVEENLVLPGWEITESGFEYQLHSYNANFGMTNYVGQQNFPELNFSVHVQRQFLEAFISKFISQFVVASMIFAILLIGTRDERKAGWYGFSAKDVVLGCAALFFVVIFEHTALRQALPYSHIMYMECFYFVMYIVMMLVTMNALWFASHRFRLVQFRDNFIPKLLYWPLLTGMLLACTIGFFY